MDSEAFEKRMGAIVCQLPVVEDLLSYVTQLIPAPVQKIAVLKQLKAYIENNRLKPKDVPRCEKSLIKIESLMVLVNQMRLQRAYERMNKHKPFLIQLIKKLEESKKIDSNSKTDTELKYVKSVLLILEKKMLNVSNVQRCEVVLTKLVNKIQANTLNALQNDLDDTKTELVIDHGKKSTDIEGIFKQSSTVDPRIGIGKLYYQPTIRGTTLVKSSLQTPEERRLAYNLKPLIKRKPIAQPSVSSKDPRLKHMTVIPTNAFDPPENISDIPITQINDQKLQTESIKISMPPVSPSTAESQKWIKSSLEFEMKANTVSKSAFDETVSNFKIPKSKMIPHGFVSTAHKDIKKGPGTHNSSLMLESVKSELTDGYECAAKTLETEKYPPVLEKKTETKAPISIHKSPQFSPPAKQITSVPDTAETESTHKTSTKEKSSSHHSNSMPKTLIKSSSSLKGENPALVCKVDLEFDKETTSVKRVSDQLGRKIKRKPVKNDDNVDLKTLDKKLASQSPGLNGNQKILKPHKITQENHDFPPLFEVLSSDSHSEKKSKLVGPALPGTSMPMQAEPSQDIEIRLPLAQNTKVVNEANPISDKKVQDLTIRKSPKAKIKESHGQSGCKNVDKVEEKQNEKLPKVSVTPKNVDEEKQIEKLQKTPVKSSKRNIEDLGTPKTVERKLASKNPSLNQNQKILKPTLKSPKPILKPYNAPPAHFEILSADPPLLLAQNTKLVNEAKTTNDKKVQNLTARKIDSPKAKIRESHGQSGCKNVDKVVEKQKEKLLRTPVTLKKSLGTKINQEVATPKGNIEKSGTPKTVDKKLASKNLGLNKNQKIPKPILRPHNDLPAHFEILSADPPLLVAQNTKLVNEAKTTSEMKVQNLPVTKIGSSKVDTKEVHDQLEFKKVDKVEEKQNEKPPRTPVTPKKSSRINKEKQGKATPKRNIEETGTPNTPSTKKKRRNELSALEAYNMDMFIGADVMKLQGKRRSLENQFKSPAKNVPPTLDSKNVSLPNIKIEDTDSQFNIKPCYVNLTPLQHEPSASAVKTEKTGVKNIDPYLHLQTDLKKRCAICNIFITRSACHYINMHPTEEFFVSRLNPKQAYAVLIEPNAKDGEVIDRDSFQIAAKCKMCLQKLTQTKENWVMHLLRHTAEFECTGCHVRHGNPAMTQTFLDKYAHAKDCTGPKFITDDIKFTNGDLMAYMCKFCSYVQLQKKNLFKHLDTEHDQNDDDDNEHNILQFVMIGYNSEPETPTFDHTYSKKMPILHMF